jgi:uncharacterized tellurite resistance protein B-like protein
MTFSDILNLFRQGKGTAKSHMKNLIEMAAVDGNFDDVEYDLLKKLGRSYNISESQLKQIRQSPEGISFEVPTDENEKFRQLYELVHMMVVDKQIHDEEMKLCNLFAVKFGYKREKVNDLIKSIKLNIENGQPYQETMMRVKLLL